MITVDEFSALGQEDQISRLERLGRIALREIGVEPTAMSSLVHAENTTFKVESPQGTFNLRIGRPGYQTDRATESEIRFLSALREAGHRVPKPYVDRLIKAGVDEVPEVRNCVLFHWMGGDFKKEALTSNEAALIGETTARFHEFTLHWQRPEGFERGCQHAWAFETDRISPLNDPAAPVSEENKALLIEVNKRAETMLRELPQTPENFGLIHGDMHVGNVLFEDDHLNVIDFDDTSFAFYLYDFSAILAYEAPKPNYLEVRDGLFRGYESVRPLPPRTDELLPLFIQSRLAGVSDWVLARMDNPRMREKGPDFIAYLCDSIRAVQRS